VFLLQLIPLGESMKILLASSNEHKFDECKQILKKFEVLALHELLEPFEIEEYGSSFKENALIKASSVFNALSLKQQNEWVVLSDDSGLCVDALDSKPGIFSARFCQQGGDENNRLKLIKELGNLGLCQSPAHFCSALALSTKFGNFTMQGKLHGKVISEQRGKEGFGYDSLFIPKGFDETLAQLGTSCKNSISHRFKALVLAELILGVLKRRF